MTRKEPKTFDPKKLKNIKPTYTVSLTLGSDTYKATSDDLTEAILALKPKKISSRAEFTLDYLGQKATLIKPVARTKRILSHRLTATIMGRTLLMLLK